MTLVASTSYVLYKTSFILLLDFAVHLWCNAGRPGLYPARVARRA